MFAYGRGVAQNDGDALEWFRRAADQGDPLAQQAEGDFDLHIKILQ
jgi:TPR repeat protein